MPDPQPEPEPEFELGWLTSNQSPAPNRPAGAPVQPKPESSFEGYDVEGPDPIPLAAPILPIDPIPAAKPKGDATPRKAKPQRPPSSGVDQVWSRGAEWDTSLIVLGAAMLGLGYFLYTTFSIEGMAIWIFLLLTSIVVLMVLAYPIFITLERPVRITPEQAVKDYFAALSHRVPHYKRMWLLLAKDGKENLIFSTFDEFKSYWKTRLMAWRLKARNTSSLNPFDVEVAEFKSDKSAGQTEVEAEYTARVVLHGKPDQPVTTYRVALRLVRGEDKMWYLESGSLDES
jgi:hypothetical protein